MTNEAEAPERIWVTWPHAKSTGLAFCCQARPPATRHAYVPEALSNAKGKRIEELEAERDELTERVDELQQACEVVSSEFEGELWQSCRRLLQKTQFDFHGADVDGIQAGDFESHMNETLVEFDHAIARIADLEAKLAKAEACIEIAGNGASGV